MSRRTRNTVIVIVLLALLFLGLWLWLSQRAPAAAPAAPEDLNVNVAKSLGGQLDTSTTTKVGGTNAAEPAEPAQPAPEPAKPDTRANLQRLAAAFAERYGSFSNTSNFENLLDLKFFMTKAMAVRTDAYVAEARAKGGTSAEFYGSTTRAISAEVVELDEKAGTAKVLVQTQKQTVSGGTDGAVSYQELTLTYRQEGDLWQVDSATWATTP